MRNISAYLLASLIFLTSNINAQECPADATYLVKKNEYLSNILLSLKYRPLYGRNGYLAYISQLNNLGDANVIYPDMKIILRHKCVDSIVTTPPEVQNASQQVVSDQVTTALNNNTKELTTLPSDSHFYIGAGAGLTGLDFKQTDDTNLDAGSFSTRSNLSLHMNFGIDFKKKWNAEFNYHQIKSTIHLPPALSIDHDNYTLQNYSGLLRYVITESADVKYRSRLGYEVNQVPYLTSGLTTDVELVMIKLSEIDLGIEAIFQSTENLSWVLTADILPVLRSKASTGTFTAEMGLPLVLSAKSVYQFTENFRGFALFEHKQQNIKYTYERVTNSKGTLKLASTELRLQVEYLF